MDNSKKLTHEEIIRNEFIKRYPIGSNVKLQLWDEYFAGGLALKQYTAQEVADKNAEIEKLRSEYSEYTIRAINDQAKFKHVILEKHALLKEAIDLLDRALIYMIPETSEEGELIENDISDFMIKTTGKEAGNDGICRRF